RTDRAAPVRARDPPSLPVASTRRDRRTAPRRACVPPQPAREKSRRGGLLLLPEHDAERLFPGVQTVVQLCVRDRARAEHADAVPGDTRLQQQKATLQRLTDDRLDELGGGLLRDRIADELDGQHGAEPTHVADPPPPRLPTQHTRPDRVY